MYYVNECPHNYNKANVCCIGHLLYSRCGEMIYSQSHYGLMETLNGGADEVIVNVRTYL